MGVLNVRPFLLGRRHPCQPGRRDRVGLKLLDDGADIIDVGGEFTRPGFRPVSPDEEAKRVIPVIRSLADAGAVVSVDTRHPQVARLAVKLGASIVNDVTGFTNPDMVRVAVESDAAAWSCTPVRSLAARRAAP